MNNLEVHFLFVLLKLSILVSLTAAGELGESACMYFGDYDLKNQRCHKDPVKIKYLPEECTSYVYNGITCNEELKIAPSFYDEDTKIIKSLSERKPKNVFVYYKRSSNDEWYDSFFTADPAVEAQKVKDFVDEYQLGGLILYGIEYVFLPNSGDFYKSFSAYVKAFKTVMPDLKIGFYFSATDFLSNWNQPEWFDFSKMNGDMDFYVIDFTTYNTCSYELIRSGITPVQSTSSKINTLTKFAEAYKGSTIAKDKVHFQFLINPVPRDDVSDLFAFCELSYNEFCENADYVTKWCVDNQDTFYEKGQFAKQHAKGFIARDIDLIDRDLKCQCNEDKYITFHMVLNGYKGAEKLTCDRLKGQ